jgi:hypothetical protein
MDDGVVVGVDNDFTVVGDDEVAAVIVVVVVVVVLLLGVIVTWDIVVVVANLAWDDDEKAKRRRLAQRGDLSELLTLRYVGSSGLFVRRTLMWVWRSFVSQYSSNSAR